MGHLQSWLVVLSLALGTFAIRYSFIGLFAQREMPRGVQNALQLMVPAIFAAIVFTGVVMVNGQVGGLSHWPKYAAALVALGVALATRGNTLWTVAAGMASLHGLPALVRWCVG